MNYERYGLSGNPFQEEAPDFKQIDRTAVRAQLSSQLSEGVASGSPHLFVLLGEYGTGKTFTIKHVIKEIREGTFLQAADKRVLVAYLKAAPPKMPSAYARYLYSSVMEEIGQEWFAESVRVRREATSEIGFKKAVLGVGTDFREALARFGGPAERQAWSYLIADKLPRSDLDDVGVSSPISTDSDAESALFDFLKFCAVAGVRSVIIFVDEIEYILSPGSGSRVAQVLTTFKEIYDRTNERILDGEKLASPIFVFASTPSAWGDLIPEVVKKSGPPAANAAFWERVDFRFDLPPFLQDDTRDLIRDRLAKRRTGLVADSLSPFERDVVPMIHHLSQGIPRRIIRICSLALKEAAERDVDVVDEPILQRAFESYPWPKSGETEAPTS